MRLASSLSSFENLHNEDSDVSMAEVVPGIGFPYCKKNFLISGGKLCWYNLNLLPLVFSVWLLLKMEPLSSVAAL